jgi:guanylate kinase
MVYAGKYYGTLKSELQRIWLNNRIPLVDIDVQGSIAIKTHYPKTSLSVFIKPPSIEVLRERLIKRGTEGLESLEERISKATYELAFASQFDTVHINDDLEATTKELLGVVKAFISK